jgi:anthranilate synthase component 1
METYNLKTSYKKILGDTFTPVSIYLKLRDKFPNSILLESSDYHTNDNSYSYICCNPIASIIVDNNTIIEKYPDKKESTSPIKNVRKQIKKFVNKFQSEKLPFSFINNGFFGYIAYDAIEYFEDIKFKSEKDKSHKVPDIYFSMYSYIIAINHFKNELYIFHHTVEETTDKGKDNIEYIESLIYNKNFASYKFYLEGKEHSHYTDSEFAKIVQKGKEHCHRGDVFQIVLSRPFSQNFKGDEFNVYRSLRSINPSPYLFFFDYGNFKIMGSSPEAQIIIKNRKASIHPIAGTFRRTGDDKVDAIIAEELMQNEKENAEHIMLVDLARNDLSRNSSDVKVEVFREIQYYSHLIHLVSKVSGQINKNISTFDIVTDTFPAGTLSGAPKYRAMQLIDEYETISRGFYGGCIGYMGLDEDFNLAIMIRSFLSKNNVLHYQAGAGIVDKSIIENEVNEVNNKLLALKTALKMATEI